MKDLIFRVTYSAIILPLLVTIIFCYGYHLGHTHGYTTAVGDIELGYMTPQQFFLRNHK